MRRRLLVCLALAGCCAVGRVSAQDGKPGSVPGGTVLRKDSIDLTEVVSLARRLGGEKLFDSSEAFFNSAPGNFLRVYRRMVNRTQFVSYPAPDHVARHITIILQDQLELSRALYQLQLPCSPLQPGGGTGPVDGEARLRAQDARQLEKASRKLERDFSSMFLEATSTEGRIRPLLPVMRRGATCAQVEEVIRISSDLRQRLLSYFFAPDIITVPLQRLNALPISSLASAIRDTARQWGRQ